MDKTPAEIIRTLRRRRKWSVQDLADRVGRSERTIEGWEQGRTVPPAALRSIQKLYATTVKNEKGEGEGTG